MEPIWGLARSGGGLRAVLGRSWGVLGRLGGQDRPRARGPRVLRPHGARLGLHFKRFFGAFSVEIRIIFLSYLKTRKVNYTLAR